MKSKLEKTKKNSQKLRKNSKKTPKNAAKLRKNSAKLRKIRQNSEKPLSLKNSKQHPAHEASSINPNSQFKV